MSSLVQPHPNTIASSRTLVVGGSAGIGAAVVSAALANGGSVHVSSSNPEKIAAKITELKTLYPAAIVTGSAADLSDGDAMEQNIKNVLEEAVKALGGPIDHLVCTAGQPNKITSLSDLEAKDYFKTWNVRCLAPLLFAKTLVSSPGTYMKVNAASSITLTSGVLAHKPLPGVAHLVGRAGAIETIGRALAVDLAPMRVNIVAPGAIYTEMLAAIGETAIRRFQEATLVKNIGLPHEAAEAYLYSMRSAFVNGEVIKVDGGACYA